MLFGIKRKSVFVVRIIVVVIILITDVPLTIFVKILLIRIGDRGAIVDVIVNAIFIAVGVITTATAFAGRELILDNIIGRRYPRLGGYWPCRSGLRLPFPAFSPSIFCRLLAPSGAWCKG